MVRSYNFTIWKNIWLTSIWFPKKKFYNLPAVVYLSSILLGNTKTGLFRTVWKDNLFQNSFVEKFMSNASILGKSSHQITQIGLNFVNLMK